MMTADPSHVMGGPRKAKKRSRGESADSSQAQTGKKTAKKRKQRGPKFWLPDLGLFMEDKKDLEGTGMLCDRVVKAAVLLLRRQFQDATGFPCIRAVGYNVKPTNKPTVQIHMDLEGQHAFVTACHGTNVIIADSGYTTSAIGNMGIRQIENSYKYYVEEPMKNIKYLQVDQQTNAILDRDSCVVHAIANTYELLAADGNTECVYNRQLMRRHLLQCFINREITEFPKVYKMDPAQQPIERPSTSGVAEEAPPGTLYITIDGTCQNLPRTVTVSEVQEGDGEQFVNDYYY